jgi:hypothetical protein
MIDFTIKTKISKKDFLLLSLVISFSHNFIKVTTIIGLVAVFLSIIFSIFKTISQNEINPLLIIGITFSLFPVLILYKTSVLYDKSNELSEEFTLHFNDAHFKVVGQESSESITWDRVIKVKNVKNRLIIFIGIHNAKVINKKYLSEEQKNFIIQKGA